MITKQPVYWYFADHRLDQTNRELIAPDGTLIVLPAKAFDVLIHLIEHRDRVVDKDDLLAEVWAGRVVEENNLTQAVSALRRALGTGAGDHRYIVTVRGRGYRFVAAVDDAGAAETADGAIAARSDADRSPAVRPGVTRRLSWFVLAALPLAVILVTMTTLRDRSSGASSSIADSSPPTLAVLPFHDVGDEGTGQVDTILGLGMAETLIVRLSRSTSMRVLSLGSVQTFDDPKMDPVQIGMTLGADYVVHGSTQRNGDSIRVNARLVSLPDGHSVWAGTFDEVSARAFTLQDALAEGMSSALSLQFPVAAAGHRSPCDGTDAHAYRAYLRGRHLMFRPDRFQLPRAIVAFREAIDHDPRCARAWAGIAFAYRSLAMTADTDPHEAFAQARTAIANALAIDPDLAEAHASKGVIEFWHDWDWASAEASLRHAIELDANLSEAHYALAHLLNNLERHDEAEPHARNASLLDPLSPVINTVVASFFLNNGKLDEAERRLHKVLELNPDFWLALYMRGSLAFARGDITNAIIDLRRADEACGSCSHAQAMLVLAYVRAGEHGAARQVLADMQARDRDGYYPASRLALAQEALGRRERALDLLERAHDERDLYLAFLIVDKRLSGMYREPRFIALRQRMNLQSAGGD